MKEVALAKIIQPSTRDMHHTRMSDAVMKVNVTEVLPEFRDIDPPHTTSGSRQTLEAWRMRAVDAGMAQDPDSSWRCSSWDRAHRWHHLEASAPDSSAPIEAATESCCGGTDDTSRRRLHPEGTSTCRLHPEGTSRSHHHRSEATAAGGRPEATAGRRRHKLLLGCLQRNRHHKQTTPPPPR